MNAAGPLTFMLILAAAPVQAQVPQVRPGLSTLDLHRYQADQHRYEMDRLRLQADQREMNARLHETETRLNRLRIEAARQPAPVLPPPYRPVRSPEEERALRLSAEERNRAMTDGVGQIDAWLDRQPD
ncbi:hypothetical protein [Brevundimonas sp. Root1423]|uniref:hypothetical protein n=1 Tax=Brevundimonas sp. Root1423 TaxID=1736462 RepID=UPI0006F86DEC|nr:hypothetical protein [Brevundimonas sp. Root1423]KQY84885.1 hypothetical protein ASD25_07695 [Brevundimonas sp. Root1423]